MIGGPLPTPRRRWHRRPINKPDGAVLAGRAADAAAVAGGGIHRTFLVLPVTINRIKIAPFHAELAAGAGERVDPSHVLCLPHGAGDA